MDRFIASAIQLNAKDNVSDNFHEISRLVQAAANDGAQLVVLPEYSNYLSDDGKVEHAESLNGTSVQKFQELASAYKIFFHCGSFLEKSDEPDRAYNTSILISPTGKILATYRKIHLFDISITGNVEANESKSIKPGTEAKVAVTDLCNIGLTICYDLRFPELFRKLMEKGAQVITVPAAFTLYTGKDHWESLLRARAIENQVYIIAPGQFGIHPNNKACFGNSMIIDPWGTVLARAPEGTGYVLAQIELNREEKIREQIPCLKNRRQFA